VAFHIDLDESDVFQMEIVEPPDRDVDAIDRAAVFIGQRIAPSMVLRPGSAASTRIAVVPASADNATASTRTAARAASNIAVRSCACAVPGSNFSGSVSSNSSREPASVNTARLAGIFAMLRIGP
jgi:tetrahydrodipicolinate N-succinyltransferase